MPSRYARFVALGSLLAMALVGCAAPARPAASLARPPASSARDTSSARPVSSARPAVSPAGHVTTSPAGAADILPGQLSPLLSAAFVSPSQGWLLVSSRCGRVRCLELLYTTDGGHRWTVMPSAQLARPALASQIRNIRFADSRDGWAYGSRLLLATHDGGRSWQAAALPGLGRPRAAVLALDVVDGSVDVLVAEGRNPDDGGPSQLYSSDVAGDSWRPAPAVGVSGATGSLTAAGGVGYAALAEESATAAGTTVTGLALFRSGDGRDWTRLAAPPCAGTPAAATSTLLYLVCVDGAAAGSTGKLVYRSADGGRTWRHLPSAPSGGDLDEVAASPGTLLVSWGGGAAGIYASLDGGAHWATAYVGRIPYGMTELEMISATCGYAIDSGAVLLMTRDAGRHWAAVLQAP